MAPLPLEGYRIIDMTEVWAGPMGTSFLGDLGAEVLRIESYPRASSSRPTEMRPLPPGSGAAVGRFAGDPNAPRPWDRSSSYHLANRNKKGFALNLATERGKELFYRLVSKSDAFVIGYSAGTATKLGIDYPVLREHRPDLIMVSMPGWGERGPYQDYVTLGSGLDAYAGHYYLRGYPDLDPTRTPQIFHSDATGALAMSFAIVAALRHRNRTGQGQFIDMSQVEVLLTHMPRPAMEWVMNNRVVPPVGNVDPTMAPHGAYPSSEEDSWVTIAVRTDDQWRALAGVIGEAWAQDERFASVPGRLRHRQEIDAHLGEWTRQQTNRAVTDTLEAAGVAAGPVYSITGPPSDPHLEAVGYYREVPHSLIGPYRRPGPVWHMSETPVQFRIPTNLLGEHNRDVFCGILGLSEEEYLELERQDITGDAYKPGADLDPEDRASS
ncbi:MAG TPA: CoA transferase [Dehalococcoidia bacterium]|nr:CoA transferase [Dehalococcoidia bacterium]